MKLTISLSADVRDTVISALKEKTQLIVTPHKSNPNGVVLRAKGAGSSHVLTVSDVGGGHGVACSRTLYQVVKSARCYNRGSYSKMFLHGPWSEA